MRTARTQGDADGCDRCRSLPSLAEIRALTTRHYQQLVDVTEQLAVGSAVPASVTAECWTGKRIWRRGASGWRDVARGWWSWVLRRKRESWTLADLGREVEARRWRCAVGRVVVAATATLLTMSVAAQSAGADTSIPSGIGNALVRSIVVSPAYTHSGLVIAVGSENGCTAACQHLWRSADGGHRWSIAAAKGWNFVPPSIAVAHDGHEILLAAGTHGYLVSDDLGDNWHSTGPNGTPTPSPDYGRDGTVAVAAGVDFLVRNGHAEQVAGSSGQMDDLGFAFSPSYPQSTTPAALLSGVDRHSGAPLVASCDASLTCAPAVPLPGATSTASPVTLLPSPSFARDRFVLAQTMTGLYRSTDGGHTFVALNLGLPSATASETPAAAVDARVPETAPPHLYAAVLQAFVAPQGSHDASRTGGGILASPDGGTTWRAVGVGTPLDGGATAVAVAPDGRLFAGYVGYGDQQAAGLLCSSDAGTTWVASCPGTKGDTTATTHCPSCASSGAGGAVESGAGTDAPSAAGSGHGGVATATPGADPPTTVASARTGPSGSGRGGVVLGGALGIGSTVGVAAAVAALRRRRSTSRAPR